MGIIVRLRKLLGILRYLQHWELLAQLARQVIPFHEDEEKWPKRLSVAGLFVLAEVVFEQKRWEEAEQWSEKVLQEALGEFHQDSSDLYTYSDP